MARKRTVAMVTGVAAATVGILTVPWSAIADQQILDDLIVDGSACVGFDCVNGESFGFDTLRLKENNLRIKFEDTSSSASFPSNDWQLTANDTNNGGANKFSIDDITGSRTPFTVEAGARNHALYVESDGDVGLGTNNPAVDLEIVTGNTPTTRLAQDGSSGFTSQTWDIAGNEANFFIRDVTNGSKLPFRIQPGAPSQSIYVANDGDIGLRTSSPQAPLHVQLGSSTSGNGGSLLLLERNGTGGDGQVGIRLQDTDTGSYWAINATDESGVLNFSRSGSGSNEFTIKDNGVLRMRTIDDAPASTVIGSIYFDSSGAFCIATGGGTWTNISGVGSCV